MSATNDPSPHRSKKACTQCRQQKAKCDAYMQASNSPCSRCGRLGLECLVVEGFEREHKRRKLYQLQNETQQLRSKLQNVSADIHSSPKLTVSPPPTGRATSSRLSPETPTNQESPAAQQTLPRVRGDLILESDEVDHLFSVFFREYGPILPILDPLTSPNYYYEASKPLFWSIITVASRNYDRRPDLMQAMSSNILDLAKTAMTPRITIRSVQALLLLLTWPISREQGSFDPTFTLSGALLHMCTQLGLHTPFYSQEFSRDKLELTIEDLGTRASLWAYSVMTYQRSCIIKGGPAMALADITLDPDQHKRLMAVLPADLEFQLRAQDLVVQASSSLARSGLQTMSADQERTMDMIIENYLSQLNELDEPEHTSTTSQFIKVMSQLTIYVFYFYQHPSQWCQKRAVISRIASLASHVIEMVEKVHGHFPVARTWYFLFGVLHSTTSLVRLFKTPTIDDELRANIKDVLQRGIAILKASSLGPPHLPGRAANILAQSMRSNKIFIHPESAPDQPQLVPLRIRSRLAMSHVLDVWCWVREETAGNSGVYPIPLKDVQSLHYDGKAPQTKPADAIPPQTNGYRATSISNNAAPVSFDAKATQYNTSATTPHPSNILMDPIPMFSSEFWPQSDVYTDLWNFWPDEDWGSPDFPDAGGSQH